MKLKNYLSLSLLFIFSILSLNAQNKNNANRGVQGDVNFITRIPGAVGGKLNVKGDVTLIGNSIIGRAATAPTFAAGNPIPTNLAQLTLEANAPYNGTGKNNDFSFEYIDIDGDPTTFSSSSADLKIKNLAGTSECVKVAYAGLYWAGSYAFTRSTRADKNNVGTPALDDWNKVKLKLPTGGYIDITVDKNNANVDVSGQEDAVIVRDAPDPLSDLTIGAPYVCYKNITNLIQAYENSAGNLDNQTANGTYTLANMRSGLGENQNGISSGWNMVIVYTNSSLPSKYITIYDGYKYIQAGQAAIDFTITDFETVNPPFPVRARIGVAGLEGDFNNNNGGDQFQFTSPVSNTVFNPLSNDRNPFNDFFNSTISVPTTVAPFSAINLDRNPNSTNTLGFDLDLIDIPNPNNSIIANGETGAKIRFPSAPGDTYSAYLLTFAVDVIAPKVVLTKVIKNSSNVLIPQDSAVALGQELTYEITYQNIGNDNGLNLKIKDILPNFVTLQSVTTPLGVTYTNTPTVLSAGTLLFTIPNNQIPSNSPSFYTIKIVVKVTSDPNVFLVACSNIIKNTASATYNGQLNDGLFFDDSVAANTNCPGPATSTNFIAGLNNPVDTINAGICGTSITLTAPPGYTGYVWTNVATGAVVGNSQTYTVLASAIPGPPTPIANQFALFNVQCLVPSPCYEQNIKYKVTILANSNITNPVDPFADEIRNNPATPLINQCATPQAGSMPIIYLCGNEKQLISPNISGTTFIWEKLTDPDAECVNPFLNCSFQEDSNPATPICAWTNVGTGATFLAEDAGEYRITINFSGGCFRTFNFKVFKSSQTIDATIRNISCEITGRITVTGLPAIGYQFSINGTDWQPSPIFNNVAQGSYNVCARLISTVGTPGACTYCISKYVDNTSLSFTVNATVIQPLCYGDKGSISIQVSGASPQYIYKITKFTVATGLYDTVIYNFGPTPLLTTPTNVPPISPGKYKITGSNEVASGNCTKDIFVEIIEPELLKLSANLTTPVTCEPGTITITPTGGVGPYFITYDGGQPISTLTTLTIPVPLPNTGIVQNIPYSFAVVDSNNCEADTTFSISTHPEPEFTVSSKNIYCYGNLAGEIKYNLVSNLGNYVIWYSINDGVDYFASNLFTGLAAGTYKLKVRYSFPTTGNVDCFKTLPDIIITEPAAGLIAAGGVSELACSTLGGKAKVRITNPQGGTPFTTGSPYIYYFPPNQPPVLPNPFLGIFSTVGSQTSNEGLLNPGLNQIVWIQDASGCSFPMTVSVDPPPTEATITPGPIAYTCDGNATQTYTVNSNGGNFSYQYFLDSSTTPNPGPTPNKFENLACGPHNIRVEYTAINIPTFNKLLVEDFGSGPNSRSPGINPDYCFERQIAGQECKNSLLINDGDYAVTNKIDPTYTGAWTSQAKDHTDPLNTTGRFLCVNIGGTAGLGGILYSKLIKDIIPTQAIKVSLWYMNLLIIGNGQPNPNLTVQLVKDLGLASETVIASDETGYIDKTEVWLNKIIPLNPFGNSSLYFVIRSNETATSGNDIIIDDIEVYQEPKQCTVVKNFPININCGKAFTAQVTGFTNVSCVNGSNGTVTIAAQNFNLPYGFDYSINGGTTWINSTVSPVTINSVTNPIIGGILAGPLTILVRYDSSSLPCTQTLTQLIGTNPALVASATATQATCKLAASIDASASSGGTPGYTYQLLNSPSLTTLAAPFASVQAGPLFSGVPPGTYVVKVTDSNSCPDNSDVALTIDALPTLGASLSTDSKLCYNPTTQGTIIVTPTGGSGTILYAIANTATGPFIFATPNSNTFSNLGPGTYYVKVLDAKQCDVIVGPIVIAPQLVLSANLVRDISCNLPAPANNAQITATATGGLAPLTFQISLNGGTYVAANTLSSATIVGNTLTYNTLTPGTVRIRVADAKLTPYTCTDESALFTITEPVKVTGTATPTQKTCDLNNGTVTLAALTGAGGYTYSFGSPAAYTATTFYPGLAVGSYQWSIKDSKGCTVSGTVDVTQPNPIAGTLQIKTNYTCAGKACIEVINTSGGTPAAAAPFYTYSLGGVGAFQESPEFCNLTDGTYTVTIKDSKGCTFVTNPVTIAPLVLITDMTFSNTAANCPSQTASVTITSVVGGSATYTYSIVSPTSLAITNAPGVNTFNNLPPSTPIKFKVVDSKGCEYEETYNFAPVTPIAVNGSATNVQCFNSSTGTTKFNVSGFSTTFSYTITPNNASPVRTGSGSILPITVINTASLPVGSYTIVVTDNVTNCTATTTVDIINPPAALTLTPTVSPKTCFTGGRVSVTTTGGWGGNVFTITYPDLITILTNNNGSFSNLTQNGTYRICVKDANDCEVCDTFIIGDSGAPTLTLLPSDFCFDSTDKAVINVSASGGSGVGYQYFFSPITPSSSPNLTGGVFGNLNPGTYNIVVRDGAGCISNPPITVTINPQLTVLPELVKGLDCSSNPNAEYKFTVANGYPGYSYQVKFDIGSFLPLSPIPVGTTFNYIFANGPGTYIIKIIDSKGCSAETTIVINPLIPVTATATQVNVKCNGSNTGSFNVVPSGGTGPYSITITGPGSPPNSFSPSGLVAGTYNYVVTDFKGCTFSNILPIIITEPTAILASPFGTDIIIPGGVCNGLAFPANGTVCIPSITGGSAPYRITLTDNSGGNPEIIVNNIPANTNYCFNGLAFGIYSVAITDASNCSISYPEIKIALPPNGLNIDTSAGIVTCATGASITLDLSGPLLASSTTFYYGIYNPTFLPPPASPFTLFNPSDPNAPNLPLPARPYYVGPFGPNYTFTGLDPGTLYTFTVYSVANQCHYTQTATTGVASISPLIVSPITVNNISCRNNTDASVNFTFSNYIGATSVTYEIYRFLGSIPTGLTGISSGLTGAPVIISNFGPILTPGKYYIRFILNDGVNINCVQTSAPFDVLQAPSDLTLTTSEIKKDACNLSIGVASGLGDGGGGDYTYRILTAAEFANPLVNIPYTAVISPATLAYTAWLGFLNSATWTATRSFTGKPAGIYYIFVKDKNGCVTSKEVTIGTEPALVLDPLIVICNNVNNYIITATASGGFGTKIYSSAAALPTATPGVFTFPAPSVPTDVTIEVTDANGCKDGKTIRIYPKLNVSLIAIVQPTCVSGTNTSTNNGSVTANAIGGSGSYAYSISSPSSPATQAGNVFTNMTAGVEYTISVTDTNIPTNCTDIAKITLVAPIPVVITGFTKKDVSCISGRNGQITINLAASNTNVPYTYIFNPLALNVEPAITQVANNIFNNIPAGTWTVRVISNSGCQDDVIVVIDAPTQVAVSGGLTNPFTCNNLGISTVTLVGANGTVGTGYFYSQTSITGPWQSSPIFPIADTGANQTLTYYIKDNNGCTGSGIVNINTANKITDFTIDPTQTISCTAPAKVQIINVVGGSGNYVYAVNGLPSPPTSNNLFDLPTATTYSVRVTDTGTGCYLDKDYTVAPFGNYSVVMDPPTAITCFGGTSSLTFNVSGFVGAFTYEINTVPVRTGSGNAGTAVTENLVLAGVYSVKVKQSAAPECSITSNTVTITAPAVPLSINLLSNVNAFCTSLNAVVTIQGQGGTPSTLGYTYYIGSTNATPALAAYSATASTTFTANLDPNISLTWYAFVKDVNNCVIATPLTINVAKDADPTIIVVAPLGNQCDISSGAEYQINVLGNSASTATSALLYAISTNPTNFTTRTNYPVPFPTSGNTTVFITVKDKNGCTARTLDIIIYPSLRIIADITKQPFCGANDGIITVGANGGNGVNVFTINPPRPLVGNTFTGLSANVEYTVKVENLATGCSDTKKLIPSRPTDVTLLPFTKVDVKCAGSSTGSFAINIAPQTATINNNPDYTYAIILPLVPGAVPVQVGNTFTGLIAGTYTVEVTSAVNCKATQIIEIKQPNPLLVPAPIPVQASCPVNTNVSSFAEIISPLTGANAVSGGTPPYQYQFSQGGTVKQAFRSDNSYTITDNILVLTSYILTVRDANGCIISSTPVTVNPIVKLDSFTVRTDALITCQPTSLQNITVTVVTNPVAPTVAPGLTYTITRVQPVSPPFTISNNTGVFSGLNGLPVGSYDIRVTNNATGCVLQGPIYYVNPPNTFQANITNVVDVKCFGDKTGSAQITVVDNIINANDPDNAGPFTCVVTKDGNPFKTFTSTTAGPTTITGVLAGEGLGAGYYEVICTLNATPFCPVNTASFTIRQPDEIIIIAQKVTDPTCRNTGNVGEGAINVEVSGGKSPYLVNVTRTLPLPAFNYGDFAPGNIGGLIAGTYSITVTDGTTTNGLPTPCTKMFVPNIILPTTAPISGGTLSSNLSGNRLLCKDDKTAVISIAGVVGGQPSIYPYSYTLYQIVNGVKSFPNGPQNEVDFNINPDYGVGTFVIDVADGIGCGVHTVGPITITEPDRLVASLGIIKPIDCSGTGDLQLTASGGTPPYFWSTAAEGSYTQFPVATPTKVLFPKAPGAYVFYVKDANDCLSAGTDVIKLEAIPTLIIKTVTSTRVTCAGLTTGAITAKAEGGFDTNYIYTLYSSAASAPINPLNITGRLTGEFTGLPTGDYWVGVTSGGGCVSALTPITVDPQLNFVVTIDASDVKCFGVFDGTLTVNVTGALGEIEYSISPPTPLTYSLLKLVSGSNYLPLSGLAPNNYTLTIQDLGKDSNGLQNCPVTKTFSIGQPTKLNYIDNTDLIQETCSGDKNGSGTINIAVDAVSLLPSGTPPYSIFSVDGSTTFTATTIDANTGKFNITKLSGGNHSIIVKDKNGCELLIPLNLDPTIPTLPTVKDEYPCPPVNGNIVTVFINPVIAATGSGYTVTYSLDDSNVYQTSPIFVNVSPGIHFIKVKTEVTFSTPLPARTNICITETRPFTVLLIEPMILKLTDGNLNEIIAITTGGTPPYNYDFNGVNTGTVSSYVISQTDKYTVTVTDTRGCPAKVSRTFNFIDIFIPNFFSPDGDGNNDAWAPQNTFNYKNLIFYVFDRYGRKIGTFNEGEFWDGKYNGEELPSGDYWYLVKPDGANDGKEYVGNFSLYR